VITLTAVELCTLSGGIAQKCECGGGNCHQSIFAGSARKFNKPWSENEASLDIATHHSMVFQGKC
jgi:hypothetical protein